MISSRSPIGVSTVKKIYGIRSNNGSRCKDHSDYHIATHLEQIPDAYLLQPFPLGRRSRWRCKEGTSGIDEWLLFWTLLLYAWLLYDTSSLSDWISFQFQALEGLKLAEKDPNGGRRLTSQGRRDLDRIAAQIKLAAAEKAKKAAAAEAVISIA